jgi:hypothetical protein
VSPRDRLDEVARRENPSPCRESNPSRPAPSLVTTLTEIQLLRVVMLNANYFVVKRKLKTQETVSYKILIVLAAVKY